MWGHYLIVLNLRNLNLRSAHMNFTRHFRPILWTWYFREDGRILSGVPEKDGDVENWFTDQLIITWALLSSKVCTVPATNKLWEMPGLTFDPALNDSKTCFHATTYNLCYNIYEPNYHLCMSMHFDNGNGFQIHVDKFYEWTNNTINLDPEILAQWSYF